jgi:cardiolipin synthase
VIFQFYIIRADGLGTRVKDKLIAKAREGVRVYFLYDEVGSHSLPKSHRKELRDAGVRVSAFNTTQGLRNRFQINFRNHRKIVVVDGHTTWIGGHNVGDEYLGLDPEFGPWRDTHVKIVGPAAIFAQAHFLADWYWATRELPEFRWGFDPQRAVEDRNALVLGTSPADSRDSAQLFFVHALNAAKKSIWIATPYFVPDEAVIAALQLAVLRGVEVKVIVPENPDSLLVQLSAFSFVDELGDDGIQFYSYTEGFMHQKVTLIDDAVSTIGTANFDNRSFRLNFEITAVILDKDFAAEVKRMLEADLARSVPLDPEILRQKPFYFRLGVRIARLMAPIQ